MGRLGVLLGSVHRAVRAFFSVTVPMNPHAQAAIATIGKDAWRPIKYSRAISDDQLHFWGLRRPDRRNPYTVFTSKKNKAFTVVRLIVRRVKDLSHKVGEARTNCSVSAPTTPCSAIPFTFVQAEAQHRDYAQVAQVFAD